MLGGKLLRCNIVLIDAKALGEHGRRKKDLEQVKAVELLMSLRNRTIPKLSKGEVDLSQE